MSTWFERFLWNFYIIDRNSTTFEHNEEVTYFVEQMIPIFLILIFTETIIKQLMHGFKRVRLNNGITSLSLGMIMEISKVFTKGVELFGYQWLYQHRLLDLDWKSPLTWWVAAIGVDFAYYWIHRSSHEISLIWCSHQVHHSSEEYNLFTAFRLAVFQLLFSFGFYHPLALLGIPLPAISVHQQFNLFFQFWIHTELISNLGPMEWIFNIPSHHRVHHGVNKWCLDKNYGGFLIIWDRMFGTFQAERQDEKIVYGLVSQPQTFDPIYLQTFYFKSVLQRAFSMKSWSDCFKALFYGPGWGPGKPRLGDENDIPEKMPERKKYCPQTPLWVDGYLLIHFIVIIIIQQMFITNFATFNSVTTLTFMAFIFLSLFTIGSIFDGRWWAPLVETARCIATIAFLRHRSITGILIADSAISGYFAISVFIWSSYFLSLLTSQKTKQLWKILTFESNSFWYGRENKAEYIHK